jgi:hypothetical protein
MLLVLPAFAASLEVNPGDDIRALTASLSPGSEVVFYGGTYSLLEPINLVATGTESEPVILRAAEGEVPVLEYAGEAGHIFEIDSSSFITVQGLVFQGGEGWESLAFEGVEVSNSSDIILQDLEIRQTPRTGIGLFEENARVTVSGCHIHDVYDGAGIYAGYWDGSVWLSEGSISGNWIHDIGINPESSDDDGISLEVGTNGVEVSNNVIYQTSRGGITTRSTEYSAANRIEGNAIWSGYQWGIRATGSATIRNNLVFLIEGEGIYSSDSERATLESVVVSHNTVADTASYGIRLVDWLGKDGMVLANNLVINPIGLGLYLGDEDSVGEENYMSHNLVSGYVDWWEGVDPALKEGVVEPGQGYFDVVDAKIWDFYPSDSSSVRDAGDASGEAYVPETDFNGAAREGDAPDVGAYEYSGSGNPGWDLQEGYKKLGVEGRKSEEVISGGCCKDKESPAEALFFMGLLGLSRRKAVRSMNPP